VRRRRLTVLRGSAGQPALAFQSGRRQQV